MGYWQNSKPDCFVQIEEMNFPLCYMMAPVLQFKDELYCTSAEIVHGITLVRSGEFLYEGNINRQAQLLSRFDSTIV